MAMKMLLEDAFRVGDAIWLVSVPPHEVQLLGAPKSVHGTRTVIMADGVRFHEEAQTLQVDASGLSVLNLGTSQQAVVLGAAIEADASTTIIEPRRDVQSVTSKLGRGDQEFVGLVNNLLRDEARSAATQILLEVRRRHPGDFQRGKRSNFKNTPDNFWYAIVQPRVQSLSITVRGHVDRFRADQLELKKDRPGYTRFALRHPDEVSEALDIIQQSKRK